MFKDFFNLYLQLKIYFFNLFDEKNGQKTNKQIKEKEISNQLKNKLLAPKIPKLIPNKYPTSFELDKNNISFFNDNIIIINYCQNIEDLKDNNSNSSKYTNFSDCGNSINDNLNENKNQDEYNISILDIINKLSLRKNK